LKGKPFSSSSFFLIIKGIRKEIQTRNMSVSQAGKSFDIIAPFQGDPFVGHLSTPITASNFTKTYLSLLPAYQAGFSPLLRGINIGFAHGYFLLGPFTKLGPLRDSQVANFVGFVSTISLIVILTAGLLMYGYVTFSQSSKGKDEKTQSAYDLFTASGWKQFSSGFLLGGFGGAGVAHILLKLITFDFTVF
jgi:photosystem I subunit 11